jgi:pyruvate dehydrogenase E2 component (dihydrolipoamide acetyltransferase)
MDILMPQLGETVAEGKITRWFKSAGDTVNAGDLLFEIETDKTSMEVPATNAGVLTEIRVSEGEVVEVGATVGVIFEGEPAVAVASARAEAASAPPPAKFATDLSRAAAPPLQPADQTDSPPTVEQGRTKLEPFREVRTPERNFGPSRLPGGRVATPLARRLASAAGVDLAALSTSSPKGRIAARDVESAIASGRIRTSSPAPMAPLLSRGPSAEHVKSLYDPDSYQEVPLDSMRHTIAVRMVESKQTIPHFYLTRDITLARVMAVREEINAKQSGAGIKISLNDFVVKALGLSLQRVPAANAVFAEDRVLRFRSSDIGVAVAVEGGLITPVIQNVQIKSVGEISEEVKDLATRARSKKLKPQEIRGGSSAVSNLGMYGVDFFSAIINPPHATVLAVGAGRRWPVETDSGIQFIDQMTVTLSCDHRVIDGAIGAQLLAEFKTLLENPIAMMV